MVSIRDYAKMNNVSYEAIRQQVKRYEDELNGHIIKQNRTQFLDDVAVDILDQHRKENPVVIINKDTDKIRCYIFTKNRVKKCIDNITPIRRSFHVLSVRLFISVF